MTILCAGTMSMVAAEKSFFYDWGKFAGNYDSCDYANGITTYKVSAGGLTLAGRQHRVLPGDVIQVRVNYTGAPIHVGYALYGRNDSMSKLISDTYRPVASGNIVEFDLDIESECNVKPLIELAPGAETAISDCRFELKTRKADFLKAAKSYNGETAPQPIEQWQVDKFWNTQELFQVPEYRDATVQYPDSAANGMSAILYKGMAVDGRRDDVFAYIGYPDTPKPQGGYPALVMVHGGGGTAIPFSANFWNKKGYVTIIMDLYNKRPVFENGEYPQGEIISKKEVLEGQKAGDFGCGVSENHVIKTIGNIVLANSLLRSLPDVNTARTGLVGISWGSIFASVVACIDNRLNFVVPVYGHGFFYDSDSAYGFASCGRAKWDPGHFLHQAKVPIYWLGGTNDSNFVLPSMQRSWDAAPSTANHTVCIRFPHSHYGFVISSTVRTVEALLNGGVPLPRLGKTTVEKGIMAAEILGVGKGIKRAQLCYTTDQNAMHKRIWHTVDAQLSADQNTVSASLPDGTTQAFLSLWDENDLYCAGTSDVYTAAAFSKILD